MFHENLMQFSLLFLITSFYIETLDLFWQGCIPQICFCIAIFGFFSTLLIYTAAEVLNRLKELKLWNLFVSLFLVLTGFLATVYFKSTILF